MILDTFAFLFKSEGSDELKSQLKNLREETKQTEVDTQSLGDAFKELTALLAPLAAAYGVVKSAMDFSKEAEQIGWLTNLSGIATKTLGELGFMAEEFGGNIQSAAHSVMGLQRNITQLQKTGGGALVQAGMQYGLSISTDPTQMLRNVAKRMETLNTAQQVDLGRMLGLDNSTIMMLQGGLKKFNEELERAKKFNFIDEGMVDRATELMRVNRENSAVWEGLKNILLDYINPFVYWIIENCRDIGLFLHEHKGLIMGIGVAIAGITAAFIPWTKVFATIISCFTGWRGLLLGISAAIALIGDDLEKYWSGQDSLIGKLFDKFPQLKGLVDNAVVELNRFWKYVKSGDAWEDFKSKAAGALDVIKSAWQKFKLTDEFKTLSDLFDSFKPHLEAIKNVLAGVYEKIKAVFEKTAEWFKQVSGEEFVLKVFQTIATVIEQIAKGIAQIIEKFGELSKAAAEWLGKKMEGVQEILDKSEMWQATKQTVSNITDAVSNSDAYKSATNWIGELSDKVSNIWNKDKESQLTAAANAATSIVNTNTANNNNNNVQANITNNFYPQPGTNGEKFEEQQFANEFNTGVLGHFSTGSR